MEREREERSGERNGERNGERVVEKVVGVFQGKGEEVTTNVDNTTP